MVSGEIMMIDGARVIPATLMPLVDAGTLTQPIEDNRIDATVKLGIDDGRHRNMQASWRAANKDCRFNIQRLQ